MPRQLPEPEEWRDAYLKVTQANDKKVLRILRDSYADISRMLTEQSGRGGVGALVRQQQLKQIQRELLRHQAEMFRKLGLVVEAGRMEAAAAAIELGDEVTRAMLASHLTVAEVAALTDSMAQAAMRTLDMATARALSPSGPVPLSQRIYRTSTGVGNQLDRMVNSALARGLSAKEFAREVRPFYNPDVPGGTRYAAMRLARTEINAAAHAIATNHMVDVPWLEAMQWRLSRSHPKADECDTLAKQDTEGLGPGRYSAGKVPSKPHPQCFCYVTPEVQDEDTFLNGLLAGRYDSYIRSHTGVR